MTRQAGAVPVAVDEVMAMVVALAVPGALNLYDEDSSVAWGDPPGAASRRRDALRT